MSIPGDNDANVIAVMELYCGSSGCKAGVHRAVTFHGIEGVYLTSFPCINKLIVWKWATFERLMIGELVSEQ